MDRIRPMVPSQLCLDAWGAVRAVQPPRVLAHGTAHQPGPQPHVEAHASPSAAVPTPPHQQQRPAPPPMLDERNNVTDTFNKTVRKVINLEGGLSLDPDDRGNWSGGQKGKGELRGTKFGISAMSYPHLDIASLTVDDAIGIYRRDYWDAINGDDLPPALAVVAFDTAVNSGVGTARRLLAESNGSLLDFIGRRLLHYTDLKQWALYGRGWTRRFAEIVRLASQFSSEPGVPLERLLLAFGPDGNESVRAELPAGQDIIIRIKADGSRVYVRPDAS